MAMSLKFSEPAPDEAWLSLPRYWPRPAEAPAYWVCWVLAMALAAMAAFVSRSATSSRASANISWAAAEVLLVRATSWIVAAYCLDAEAAETAWTTYPPVAWACREAAEAAAAWPTA